MRAITSVLPQPRRLGAHEPEYDPEQAGRSECQAAKVELLGGAMALGQLQRGERDEDGADGDVEPEDPVPRSGLHERATDERAKRDGDAADAGPDAQGQPAALGREGLGQQGEGQRGGDRGADALDGAGGDQQCRCVGASAAPAEATVNTARPAMNMRLRPRRSPRAAPVSRSTA